MVGVSVSVGVRVGVEVGVMVAVGVPVGVGGLMGFATPQLVRLGRSIMQQIKRPNRRKRCRKVRLAVDMGSIRGGAKNNSAFSFIQWI